MIAENNPFISLKIELCFTPLVKRPWLYSQSKVGSSILSVAGFIRDRCRVLAVTPPSLQKKMVLNYWINFKYTFVAVHVPNPIRFAKAFELKSVDPTPSWTFNPFDGGCVNIEFGSTWTQKMSVEVWRNHRTDVDRRSGMHLHVIPLG